MKSILFLVFVIAISFLGEFFKKISPIFKNPNLLGINYLILGFGMKKMGFFDNLVLGSLTPVISFGLGWIGFAIGVGTDIGILKKIEKEIYTFSIIETLLSLFFNFVFIFLILESLFGSSSKTQIFSTILAFSFSASSYHLTSAKTDRISVFMLKLNSISSLFIIILFGFVVSYKMGLAPILSPILSVFLGFFFGIITVSLTNKGETYDENILFFIAILIWAASFASYLKTCPVFVCTISGIICANFGRFKEKIFYTLRRYEKVVYFSFLFFLGAMVELDFGLILFSALIFFSFALAKLLASFFSKKIVFRNSDLQIEYGLLMLGGFSLAVLLSSYPFFEKRVFGEICSLYAVTFLISQLISPFFSNLLSKELSRKERQFF